MNSDREEHVTTSGAARAAKKSSYAIYEWVRRGFLEPVMVVGNIRIFRVADVKRVAKERAAWRSRKAR